MSHDVQSVLVAILTYRRQDMLAAMLQMLRKRIDEVDPDRWHVEALVVDNDSTGSAREVVRNAAPWARYEIESAPGISYARNHALDAGAALGAELLVFIDDDEEPEPGWLSALLGTHLSCGSTAVCGRVVSRFEAVPDPWLVEGGFYDRAHRIGLRTGDVVASAATNNLLLDLGEVRRLGLRFDESLGAVGGEDTRFTLRLSRSGGRIVWCDQAVVVDVITPERATRRGAVRRLYSAAGGSVAAIIASEDSRRRRSVATVRYTATGLARLGLGAGQAVVGTVLRRPRWQGRGVRTAARGAGALSGVVGRVYGEYRRNEG